MPNNTPYDTFSWIAYRGGAGERPENTECAFEHALSLSPGIVLDLDVRLSRDGVPVVIHDDLLERTTDGVGPVAEHSLAEIERLDGGFHFNPGDGTFPFRGRDLRVPTLAQVLQRFPTARLNVDIRANDPSHPAKIIETIETQRAAERVIMVSEHDAMLAACRRLRPDWTYGAAMGEVRKIVFANKLRLQRLITTPADIFMIPETHGQMRVLDARLLRELHRRGKKVWVWIVNDPAGVARLRDLGVDGVFTEFPRRMLEAGLPR